MEKNVLYDKIYACWLGKNIGGTLGGPVEGRKEVMNITWYPKLAENGALPNDDLDLQLLGLHAVEQYGVHLTADDIAKEWTEHVYFPWDEYGYAGTAMRLGFRPPFSGMFDNNFTDCMGSPIRSEIWACMCAGNPKLAAYFAWQDAVVDHAGGEGVFGEIFNAALEAAAFESDNIPELIDTALAYIPEWSRVYKSVSCIVKLYKEGKSLEEAREILLEEHGRYNFTDAPQNIAFELTGLLWGKDFEDAVLRVVNLGYDTDCTVATCGSLWGILYGTAGIPEKWSAPVGTTIAVSRQIRGFRAPADLNELTDRTIKAREKLLLENSDNYIITDEDNRDFAVQHFTLPQGSLPVDGVSVTLKYRTEPFADTDNPCTIDLKIRNNTAWRWNMLISVTGEGFYPTDETSICAVPGEAVGYSAVLYATDNIKRVSRPVIHIKRLNCGDLWHDYTIPFTVLRPDYWTLNGVKLPFAGRTVQFTEKSADGVYTAETVLVTPVTRKTLLFCNSEAPVRLELDGEELFSSGNAPFLPAYHRSPASQRKELVITEGRHGIKIVINSDVPPRFVIGVNAPPVVEEPGNLYAYTDDYFE